MRTRKGQLKYVQLMISKPILRMPRWCRGGLSLGNEGAKLLILGTPALPDIWISALGGGATGLRGTYSCPKALISTKVFGYWYLFFPSEPT